jgi:hypothetical protein
MGNLGGLSSNPQVSAMKFRELNDAVSAAAKKVGSEAIVKHTDNNGQTYYTLHGVSENEVQNYGTADLDPNIVKFSMDLGETEPQTNKQGTPIEVHAERILESSALSSRNALEKGLKTVLPPDLVARPEVKNMLATQLGFKDFESLYNQLSQFPPDKQTQFVSLLTQPGVWSAAKQNMLGAIAKNPTDLSKVMSDFVKESQSVVGNLRGQLNDLLKNQIDGLFDGQGTPQLKPGLNEQEGEAWSPAALMGIHTSLSGIKQNSPQDFQRLQNTNPALSFKHESSSRLNSGDNIALQDPIALLTDSMKIAHTSCKDCTDHTISIREGAVQGSADPILNTQTLEKIGLFSRTNNTSFSNPEAYRKAGFKGGVNQWYSLDEMNARGLASGSPPAVNKEKALELLGQLNNTGEDKTKTWRSLVALGNGVGTFQPDLLKNNPVLKEYLKPGTAGLDMNKLWPVFFPEGNPAKIQEIQTALNELLPTVSDQSLVNSVFKMEQMKQVEGLQSFLNEIKPGLAKDLLKDGTIGPRTQVALKRLEAIMALNAIKKNLPQPVTPQQTQQVQAILNTITSNDLSNEKLLSAQHEMKQLMAAIPDKITQESPRQTLHQNLNRLVEGVDGKIDGQTTRDLVNSWLKIVDTKGEGNIIEDLVTHEVGHNLMEIFKKENPDLSLDRDWAAISGKADQSDPDAFTMAPATRSLFAQGPESVSEYGETSTGEDFAESYRLFMSNPEELYKKAPTKFLSLNALSGRFSEAEVLDRFAIDNPDKLKAAWQKISGAAGPQYHLSANMLEKLQKTYPTLTSSNGDAFRSDSGFSTEQLNPATDTSSIPKLNEIITPARLSNLLQLNAPSLTQENLAVAYKSAQKLLQYAQSGQGPLDAEATKQLLGSDYDALPEGLKAMVNNPDSLLMQYVNNPQHFSRSSSPAWVLSEVMNQLASNYEKSNESAGSFKRTTDAFMRTKNKSIISRVVMALKPFLEAQNNLSAKPVQLPTETELNLLVQKILSESSDTDDFAKKLKTQLGFS